MRDPRTFAQRQHERLKDIAAKIGAFAIIAGLALIALAMFGLIFAGGWTP